MKSKKKPQPDLETIIPLLIGVWRRLNKEAGPADKLQTREFRKVVEQVLVLQDLLATTHSPKDYFSDLGLRGAYLLYHWVLHYLQGLSILNELPRPPKRVLDICSGPAPLAFAALKHEATEVYATDRNPKALELGGEICGRYGFPLNVRTWDCRKDSLPIGGSFDLIILGHCLHELFPDNESHWKEKQKSFVSSLLDRLTPEGFLLLIESSQIPSNHRVLELRDTLVKEGVPVQAPCVWRGECPALKVANSPCYAQREFEKPYFIKEIQRAAEIHLSSLKMSYLIFRSPKASWPSLPNKPLYRVISPPVETYEGKLFYLCGTEGKKTIHSREQKEINENAKAFQYLRRGELISIVNALETPKALQIVKDTHLSVEAACEKPVKEELDPPEL